MPSKSPDAFRTISEVAEWLQTPAHVLRFWESKFSQVKPVKRAGGRRYYRPADMALIGGIKKLLHDDGMTIKGVQKILREQGIKHVAAMSPPLEEDLDGIVEPSAATVPTPAQQTPQDTGQVLEFGSRPTDDTPKTPKPAEPVANPPAAKDLFDEVADDAGEIPENTAAAFRNAGEDKQQEATEATAVSDQADEPAAAGAHEDLPDFLQKPMSERLADDEAGDSARDDDLATEPEARPEHEIIAANTPETEQIGAAGPDKVAQATDPLEQEPEVQTGPLTLLTSTEMRSRRHSAEQIETLIIRVRSHYRALTHAARN